MKNLLPLASGITATTSTSPQLLESLQKREIDPSFVTGAFSEVQGVARALIYEDDAVIVLPADLAAQKKGPWSWDDLRFCGLPLIRFVREGGGGRLNESFIFEQELSFDYTSRYFAQAAVAFGDQQKKTLGLVNKNGLYTNLALLLSDQCPYSLKAAVFQGTDKMIFRDRAEFEGSVLEQFDKALAFLEKHQSKRSVFQGAKRIDIPDYPMMAVREGLTNAVVHREYASTGPILMSIFADRLEILNQGGLLSNFTIDEVLRGVSEQRNEKLAAVFYRLGLLEGYGSGYSRMLSAYAGTGKKPEISVTRFSFMLTLPNVNGGLGDVSGRAVIREQPQQVVPAVSLEDLSERARERMQKVLQRCRQQPQITRAEAQDLLGVSQSTATLLLNAMV